MTHDPITTEKESLRKKILVLLRKQSEDDRQRKSLAIFQKLLALPEFQEAKTVLFYASFDGEVDTLEMMKQSMTLGKRIALPNIHTKSKSINPSYVHDLQEDLVLGPYGVKQSRHGHSSAVDNAAIDLSIVPGLAFDRDNFRLGRGAGYYDRFLARLSSSTPSVGLAFDFQIVQRLPRHEHDVPVRHVLTN